MLFCLSDTIAVFLPYHKSKNHETTMGQKMNELTFDDLRRMYRKNLPFVCRMADESGSADGFKAALSACVEQASDPQAADNLRYLIGNDGKTVRELSTGEDVGIRTITILWEWLEGILPGREASVGFVLDVYHQLLRLSATGPVPMPSGAAVKRWMQRWPGGMDDEVKQIRRKNKERIIRCLVAKIESHHAGSGRYCFAEGLSEEDKYDKVREWWFDHRFQLAMAARSIREINRMLDHTLPAGIIRLYHEARRKGMPVFATPYYLSLLNPYEGGYDDRAIRSYVFYSPELVDTFGQIRAWEKEDAVEPGKPNAAGWLLPDGHNIHRRYPDVAILIPDSVGRACGGLCASCQRMYDFQSKRFNFDFEKLRPAETWKHKLQRLMKYFEEDSRLCDILITGGDALMSSNKTLRNILKAVLHMARNKRAANRRRPDGEKYAEIKRVRLGTRLPVYLPMRVNDELLEILAEFKDEAEKEGIAQFYIQTHFQTPLELTPESCGAIRRIQGTGWVVTNQLVFNVAASRRGHTARLRRLLNAYGVFCYYTFSVKGFDENHAVAVPNSRSMQECVEEKSAGKVGEEAEARFLERYGRSRFKASEIRRFCAEEHVPFLATDRNVLNLPGIGKSMTFRLAGILEDGRRILAFGHDNTRRHSPVIRSMEQVFIKENKSVYEYLCQLDAMGERVEDYSSIWSYTSGQTERRFSLYEYPQDGLALTPVYTNLADNHA